MVGLPAAEPVAQTLNWALSNDKYIITRCHGPAAWLAVGQGEEESPFKGYSVCVFPDALDQGPNIDIGYLPGHLQWLVADLLDKQGLTILNDDMTARRTKTASSSPVTARWRQTISVYLPPTPWSKPSSRTLQTSRSPSAKNS